MSSDDHDSGRSQIFPNSYNLCNKIIVVISRGLSILKLVSKSAQREYVTAGHYTCVPAANLL